MVHSVLTNNSLFFLVHSGRKSGAVSSLPFLKIGSTILPKQTNSSQIAHDQLIHLRNWRSALNRFATQSDESENLRNDMALETRGTKRKFREMSYLELDSDQDQEDELELEDDEDLPPRSSLRRRFTGRFLRSQNRRSRYPLSLSLSLSSEDDGDNDGHEDEDEDEDKDETRKGHLPIRSLHRIRRRLTRTRLRAVDGDDLDELSRDALPSSSEDDYNGMPFVQSDINPVQSRKIGKRSKRLRSKTKGKSSWPGYGDSSSIEFEHTRRSGRSTRTRKNMRDDALMDEDSFYIDDDRAPTVPKIISIKEVFQQPPTNSDFYEVHSATCDTCQGGPSTTKGQLIGCQGCSLSFHKNCLGFRAAREHMVTKIGHENFVLQCRYCIGIMRKKDTSAPQQSMCQFCKIDGRSCAPFSEKKTAKQEEKIRLENDGVDPITTVAEDLVNNSENVLFRCFRCRRAWHFEHLPPIGVAQSDVENMRQELIAEYSIDWRCQECSSASRKIHALVAWRPFEGESPRKPVMSYYDLTEDSKEYLVKWQDMSYFHCTWMPGAWVYGVAASTMRISFGKRDGEKGSLQKKITKDAIPEEYLMADVILTVKMKGGKSSRSVEIDDIEKVLVKFQGLGYDEVVWDDPPPTDASTAIQQAYKAAYVEYLSGKYFRTEPQSKMKESLRAFCELDFKSNHELQAQPKGLKRGNLLQYQLDGVNWLLHRYHQQQSVILADEMGLGKTVQVVALITTLIQDKPGVWPFLVVVPNSTCPNWRREIKHWAPDLRVVTYHGGKAAQDLAYKYELFPNGTSDMRAHIVVMSYDSAQDDRTKGRFRSVHWAGLVVDEGQRLKNEQSLLYGALKAMKVPFRLLLTGTPLQNNKRELFNLIQFIDPKKNAAELDEEYSVITAENVPRLHELIRPYFLRRTKADTLKFLPPMRQIIVPVTMTILQEKLCKSIMAKNPDLIKAIFSNSKMGKSDRGSLNNILMQLRKCLCHPFIYSEAIEERTVDAVALHQNLVSASAKLLLLNIMIPKLKERGHRILIFSQFLNQLDIIEDFLTGIGYEYRRLDGNMSSLERQKKIDEFNAPDSSVFAFLLSTRAGGVGINLATADTVIILDPDFNPHQDIQAVARAHRIGQRRPVLCFQLMTKNSVEEKIMQIGRKKLALDHLLIESMDAKELDSTDVESILKHGADALFSSNERETIRYDSASVDKLLNRSDMKQSSPGEKEEELRFSYAKVWANDRGDFDDEIANRDMPVSSSVWENILKQREEEAKLEVKSNQEVLGRGGRRRQVSVTCHSVANFPLSQPSKLLICL
jgi:chromodomain-helicase-DNA-binding protein 4